MFNRSIYGIVLTVAIVLSGCVVTLPPPDSVSHDSGTSVSQPTEDEMRDAFFYNARLGRGINFGNALEAPFEGGYGMYIRDEYFPIIRDAGFDSVRIPIKWSNHARNEPPYELFDKMMNRVDHVVQMSLEHDLAAVINIHHYDEMMTFPLEHEERFLALWAQIADRYKAYPDTLYFEILNEPHNQLTDEIWNRQLQAALGIIRETNPMRPVIFGPTHWNNIDKLGALKVPPNDPNLIVTFHYYSPFEFTHQAADWVSGAEAWRGTEWTASESEMRAVRSDFDSALAWAEQHNVPLYMGEFGAYGEADMASRERWTSFVVQEAEARGFSFAYWEFASSFGAFNKSKGEWRPELLGALIQK